MSPAPTVRNVTIVNKKGLHARASAKFAKMACTYDAKIEVSREGVAADARSIMDLLMLTAHIGSEIRIEGNGNEAVTAVDALVALVTSGFDENDDEKQGPSVPRKRTDG